MHVRLLAVNSARMDDHSEAVRSFLDDGEPFGVANYWKGVPHVLHARPDDGIETDRLRVSSDVLLGWRGPRPAPLPTTAPWNHKHYAVATSAPLDGAAAQELVRQATRRLGRLPADDEAGAALDALWLKHLRRVQYASEHDAFVVTDGVRVGAVRGDAADAAPLHIALGRGSTVTEGFGEPVGATPLARQEVRLASTPCDGVAWRPLAPGTTVIMRGGVVQRTATGPRRLDP